MESSLQILQAHHSEFANFQEQYVRHYIGLADTKAAWTFTISSGVLVYFLGLDKIRESIRVPVFSISYVAVLASLILLILSAFFAFRVVAPRLKSKSGEGMVFFGSVALKFDAETYVSEVAALDSAQLTEARLKHCFDVSTVCAGKYASLKKAIWFGLPALVASVAAILLNT